MLALMVVEEEVTAVIVAQLQTARDSIGGDAEWRRDRVLAEGLRTA